MIMYCTVERQSLNLSDTLSKNARNLRFRLGNNPILIQKYENFVKGISDEGQSVMISRIGPGSGSKV